MYDVVMEPVKGRTRLVDFSLSAFTGASETGGE